MPEHNNIAAQDALFMAEALALAEQGAALGEVPVGAVLVQAGEVIGRGFNSQISLNDPSAHAEVQAIRDAATRLQNYRLPNTTLYVTLEPCHMCAGLIVHARISRVVFAAHEPRAGDRKSTRLNSSHVSISYGVFCLKKRVRACGRVTTRNSAGGSPHTYDRGGASGGRGIRRGRHCQGWTS